MAAPIKPKPQNPSFMSCVLVVFHRPFSGPRMRDRAFVRRTDQACVLLQRAGQAFAGIGPPLRFARGKLLLGHMQVNAGTSCVYGMRSPSRTRPMGPPAAASGLAYPMHMPRVAPEN